MSASKWKPYPEYKSVKLAWIDKIPADWNTRKIKHISTVENSGAFGLEPGEAEFDLPVCTTAQISTNGEFNVSKMPVRSFSSKEKEYYLGRIGDIFIVKSSGSNTNIISGKLGQIKFDTPGIIFSNFLMRIRPKDTLVHPPFLTYFLSSELTKQKVKRMVATTTYPNINVPEYVDSTISLPPLNDQPVITQFIRNIDSYTTSLVTQLEKQIHLMEEKRSTLITQAVTKGLNTDVPMKDSGIDWIGDIPQHWDIMKLKYLCETTKGKAFKSSEFSDSGFKIIRASDLKNNTVKFGDVYISEETASENINVKLHQGDILVSTVGSKPEVRNSAVGQVAKLPKELEGSFLNQNTVRLEAFESQISPEYLFNLLRNDLVRRFFDIHAHGTANQASLSLADILSFSFGMPPLKEQNEICKYISRNIQRIDDMSIYINQQIGTLNEYRTALISAAVTGKIDVQSL